MISRPERMGIGLVLFFSLVLVLIVLWIFLWGNGVNTGPVNLAPGQRANLRRSAASGSYVWDLRSTPTNGRVRLGCACTTLFLVFKEGKGEAIFPRGGPQPLNGGQIALVLYPDGRCVWRADSTEETANIGTNPPHISVANERGSSGPLLIDMAFFPLRE